MKTSVTGYPRIGSLRELKVASEKYFRNEIFLEELMNVAKSLRTKHWRTQFEAGVDYIPCNDFSFYDTVLDAAVMLGIIPKRYTDLHLSELDTYFAMARGYQGVKGDVRALALKKWFNTNYHYIVPEIEDDTQIQLRSEKLFNEYRESAQYGITTKPVVIGPYTMLKLSRYAGSKGCIDYIEAFIKAYCELILKAETIDIEWLQFDEPAIVQDMDFNDVRLFVRLYGNILSVVRNTKILLQTYFGDVRDVYKTLMELPFSGIGLDFVEGKENLRLIEEYGFPRDKFLFAGLINGKNVWRNHYDSTLKTLSELKKKEIQVVLSTSCSLLHVPYTLKNETKMQQRCFPYFAFAEEKLAELRELGELADLNDYISEPNYGNNCYLFSKPRNCKNDNVAQRLLKLSEEDYKRKPRRTQRRALQKKAIHLPDFPVTTIGSFPQTKDVKAIRATFRKKEISEQQYNEFIREKIVECIAWQEDIGLDVLVHGEYERNDMVEYFGEALEGFLFTEKGWVQSYGTRCVKPPIIWGDVYRSKPITVDWTVYAQSLTPKVVKGMLTGPVTILNWSFPREDISLKESVLQIALAIRDEVLDLEKNGIKIIQIDEAALREKLPLRKSDWYKEYLDFAIMAFRLTNSGVKPETQIHTHMCYSEFSDIIPAIDDMDADVITFEASRSDLQLLDSLKENNFEAEVGPGCYDIHSPRIPSVEEIVECIEVMLLKIDENKLWVNPDCGLKTRGITETKASLRNLVKAAEIIRNRKMMR